MKTELVENPKSASSNAGPEEAVQPVPAMRLRHILVPLDLSDASQKALPYAVSFAEQFHATLALLYVVQPRDDAEIGYTMYPLEDMTLFKTQLAAIRAANIPKEVPVKIEVRHGIFSEAIFDVAEEIEADLIITATHGYTGLKHLLLGSNAEKVVRRAPCPVLVVREGERDFV